MSLKDDLAILIRQDETLQRYFLSPSEYAIAGGGFPIAVKGTGVIGAITVSGLPDRQDHQIIVDTLCKMLGHDQSDLTLGACPFH